MMPQPFNENWSLDDQIAEVERELAFRGMLYPKWVKEGRMKEEVAKRRIGQMIAVRQTLVKLRGPSPQEELKL